MLRAALRASARKIIVFLGTVLTIVVIIGSLMYLIEGEANGFTSIPVSIYWAIVTMTTVGYGDIAPQTALGKILASAIMIMGYGIIAVPTGIVTVELAGVDQARSVNTQACPDCGAGGHAPTRSTASTVEGSCRARFRISNFEFATHPPSEPNIAASSKEDNSLFSPSPFPLCSFCPPPPVLRCMMEKKALEKQSTETRRGLKTNSKFHAARA